ncbi:DNA ligase [Exilibacterium tricleocarpae]|uniref:DNA ligase n=1 Tax=Exilibacterium tricleocarpae TaxID=2591008 RepID=A0A545U5G1_9GAMM|nr:DNA ligase [Exilibacterium tricleocarpae]TQV84710.1 DNA ligase [Exilibacterium tricleocarpae]
MPRFIVSLLSVVFLSLIGSFLYLATSQAKTPAPGLLLANVYERGIALEDYWVSEKLDGVRAYWDGRQLLSRRGNVFAAPAWFTDGFPATPLDGELWMGRDTFAELSGAVRRQIPDDRQWRRIRYMVFDLPAAAGTFDRRLLRLKRLLEGLESPYIDAVAQRRVADHAELMILLERVVDGGGEGLMLHRGDSLYAGGRSDDLLKLKRHTDAEATVIAHTPGRGKYAGMLGALVVETPAGVRFAVGSGFSDAERRRPPPVGSVITYKFYGTSKNGVPRFASFLRVRRD